MRTAACFFLVLILPAVERSAAGEVSDEFETWDDVVQAAASDNRLPVVASSSIKAEAQLMGAASETPETSVEKRRQEPKTTADAEPVIYFGAGATYQFSYRPADGASGSSVLPEFSVSWAPFGLLGEIGVDMAIGRQNTFLARPNLKFFFVKSAIFSAYLEGSCSWYSHGYGSDIGGGGALALSFGILQHMALELRVGATFFSFSPEAAEHLLGAQEVGGDELVVLASASARLLARF
jgi:hypothetical protein